MRLEPTLEHLLLVEGFRLSRCLKIEIGGCDGGLVVVPGLVSIGGWDELAAGLKGRGLRWVGAARARKEEVDDSTWGAEIAIVVAENQNSSEVVGANLDSSGGGGGGGGGRTSKSLLHTQKTLHQLHLAAAQKLQFKSPMAQVSISSAFFFVLVALAAATVSAQESAPAPAPMDAGAAYSLPVNGAVVGASLMVSVFALFKHYLN
ncbi:hypothetical protein ACFX2I_008950 [Malus domestica]